MKVALIHPHIGYKGGLETRLWNYIRWLRERDHEITLFGYKVAAGVDLPNGVHLHRFDFSRVPKPIRMSVFNWRLAKQNIRDRFDFSLSLGRTMYQTDLLVPGVHRAYLKAIKRIWSTPVDWQNCWLDDKAYKRSDRVWAASRLVKDQIEQFHNIDPGKIHVLYPPLDTARFNRTSRKQRDVRRKSLGLEATDKMVLFISSSHFLKGWPLLRQVWADIDHPQYKLAVAGKPVESNDPRIISLGFVQEMAGVFGAADLVVVPSLYESFGQIVSEAIACGTPVLVSDRVGAKEILEEPWGQVLPNNKPDQWRQAIERSLNNPPEVPDDIINKYDLSLGHHMKQLMAHLSSSG